MGWVNVLLVAAVWCLCATGVWVGGYARGRLRERSEGRSRGASTPARGSVVSFGAGIVAVRCKPSLEDLDAVTSVTLGAVNAIAGSGCAHGCGDAAMSAVVKSLHIMRCPAAEIAEATGLRLADVDRMLLEHF